MWCRLHEKYIVVGRAVKLSANIDQKGSTLDKLYITRTRIIAYSTVLGTKYVSIFFFEEGLIYHVQIDTDYSKITGEYTYEIYKPTLV